MGSGCIRALLSEEAPPPVMQPAGINVIPSTPDKVPYVFPCRSPPSHRPKPASSSSSVEPVQPVPFSGYDDAVGPHLCILHFNDSHTLIPCKTTEPIGGAARFATIAERYRRERDCLVLFSGDVFNPSRLSTVTKGKHVGPVMQALRPDCGVYGNHDFDFGVEELVKLARMCGIPWVMTNVVDARPDPPVPVAQAQRHHLFTHNSIKIGVIGIVEEEWLATIRELPDWVQYRDKVACAKEEIAVLRQQGAQVVIALSHMRENNDTAFLEAVPELDLLLGGHDHYYLQTEVAGRKLIKSSADFVNTTLLELWLTPGELARVQATQIPLTSDIEEHAEVKSILESHNSELASKLNKDVCRLTRELDVMNETVRAVEAPAGNLIADIVRSEMKCEIGLINSGLMRANLVYMPGVLKLKDIMDILPMEDIVVSLLVSGSCLREALECGFCKCPSLEGRFPQISGMRVLMDPTAPPMQRVRELEVGGCPLEEKRAYRLATTYYLSTGGDGYTPFQDCPYVVDKENGRILPTMVRQYLEDLPGADKTRERRQSVMVIKGDARLTRFERDHSVGEIRRAFLPNITPRLGARIVQSDHFSRFCDLPAHYDDDTSSILSEASTARPAVNRRTSVAHPIHITRTMASLVDAEYSHEAQLPEGSDLNSDAGSIGRPSSTVAYLQQFGNPSEVADMQGSKMSFRGPVHRSPATQVHRVEPSACGSALPLPTPPPSAEGLSRPRSLMDVGRSMSSLTSHAALDPERRPNIYDHAARGDLDSLQAQLQISKALLNRKGTPNAIGTTELKACGLGAGRDAGTPLHYAIAFGHPKAVTYLLQQGADTRQSTQMGGYACELAFANLVRANMKGVAAQMRTMEQVLHILREHEESMTEEQRFMMLQ